MPLGGADKEKDKKILTVNNSCPVQVAALAIFHCANLILGAPAGHRSVVDGTLGVHAARSPRTQRTRLGRPRIAKKNETAKTMPIAPAFKNCTGTSRRKNWLLNRMRENSFSQFFYQVIIWGGGVTKPQKHVFVW
jgi:hypothetical protein